MSRTLARRLRAGTAVLALALAFPAATAATITGGCQGEGQASSGNGANLTTDAEWHLSRDDVAGGSATSPMPMRQASVAAYALGLALPIAGGTDEDGKTAGSVDGVAVETYAILGHRFVLGGSASGDGQCSGEIEIILDDVDPLFTILGGGGIILAVIGLLAMLLFTRSTGGCLNRVLSAIFGALGGLGGALALEQLDVLDPTEPIGLFLLIGAALVGFVTAGIFGGGADGTDVGTQGTKEPQRSITEPGWPPADPGTETDVYPGGAVGGGAVGGGAVGGGGPG